MQEFRYPMVNYETADERVKAIYDDIMKTMGTPFIFNFFKCQGSNPILLKGNWEKIKSTLFQGKIPMLLKQLIIYNISKERNCEYCTFAHQVPADQLGKELCNESAFKVTEDLNSQFIPSSYKTALKIVTKCALNPMSTSEQDFEELRDEGFSDCEIQEMMAMADLTNMLNTLADISGIPIDEEVIGMMD